MKQFQFTWPAAAGADYYQLLESPDGQAPLMQVGGDTMALSTSLTVPLHARTNASYQVRACNMFGCTDSNVINVAGTLDQAVGYVKASAIDEADMFGAAVALSGDGNTLAVGASLEDSAATGIDGDDTDDTAVSAGAVYLFVRTGGTWMQQAYVKASNAGGSDNFGYQVALSYDGSTLAVGARREASNATGVNGDQFDDSLPNAGAAYVFVRDGMNVWTQQAYIKASNPAADDRFATGLALSSDGHTLAVGAIQEDGGAAGIDGDQADDSMSNAGAVYVYARDNQNVWTQQAYVKAANPNPGDSFGAALALAGDGDTLVVGATSEDSSATGIDGDASDNSAPGAGAVYVFVRDGMNVWTQASYIKASNTDAGDTFGQSVALSDDGSTLAVGALNEDSDAPSLGGDQSSNAFSNAGAAYVFERTGNDSWVQQIYVKAFNPDANDRFGSDVGLSSNGDVLLVGAPREDSASVGVNGGELNNSDTVGAAYVYVRTPMDVWWEQAYVKPATSTMDDEFGTAVSLSHDGSTLCIGAPQEDGGTAGVGGEPNDNASNAGAAYLY